VHSRLVSGYIDAHLPSDRHGSDISCFIPSVFLLSHLFVLALVSIVWLVQSKHFILALHHRSTHLSAFLLDRNKELRRPNSLFLLIKNNFRRQYHLRLLIQHLIFFVQNPHHRQNACFPLSQAQALPEHLYREFSIIHSARPLFEIPCDSILRCTQDTNLTISLLPDRA
jgi:hypothetical protein